jgi:transcriptional regulator with XRE-family HTH domain
VKISTETIHLVITDLIVKKERRDQKKFTGSQLAKLINVKASIVHRLIHPDPAKRVTNPQIETLIKIVEFFRADGFDISIDTLLLRKQEAIEVHHQRSGILNSPISIPLYSINSPETAQLGIINVFMPDHQGTMLALLSEEDIKPMFKKGSIFIIKSDVPPENNTLVAVKIAGQQQALIRKYYMGTGAPYLESYDPAEKTMLLTASVDYAILGVVIQVNVKT